ncbi:hypothetical protein L226DRAFT_452976 [Lentinus tigrinus ALCF2SS1-7]|uniref:Ras-GAP domain-containing protein n=1 Tax=Lentinus tigrinus ALCF2SS1-6 TaxID=1328759 RepID=A0A5C2SSF6_9APHY|nr:hypothetical protein L227DRAFT_537474 [Lentinus tigrinus ALCF2SS1-6]RPD80736.1 hypothetical protein L226DRAFT_452976 [Lentinus tigrinus ALCF2SS1-7]
MPARRASAGHNIASAPRVHRSNGSNHSISAQSPVVQPSNIPYASSASIPASPQQKVVQVLINRLKNKLPCNSGISLTELEADDAVQQTVEALVDLSRDSLDMISLALTEQLEKLAKQIEGAGFRGVDILQSQLFLLKVLALAMASRWGSRTEETRPNSRGSKPVAGSKPATPDSSIPTPGRGRHTSTEQLSTSAITLIEPPPLDDNCARYIISVMVLLLRQAAPRKNRLTSSASMSFDASFQDFESVESHEFGGNDEALTTLPLPIAPGATHRTIDRAKYPSSTSLNSGGVSSSISSRLPQHSVTYEKTSFLVAKSVLSLHSSIAKYTGRIVYHLSASNWLVVLNRIRQRIHGLAGTSEPDPDTVDLQLITYSALDRTKLVQSLQELSSSLINLKKDAQIPVSIALRTAIWNWIELCPDEYNDALFSHRRLEGAPERVFDLLYDLQESSRDKAGAWPTLAVLLCISHDRLKGEFETSLGQKGAYRKDRNITELMMKNLTYSSKFSEVAIVCAVDICRAASRVRPHPDGENEAPLIATAFDVAHELKMTLLKWTKERPFWECPDEIDVAMLSDVMAALYRFLPEEESLSIFLQCVEPERSEAVKICAVKACLTLIVDGWKLPWQRSMDPLKEKLKERLNLIFYSAYTRRSEVDANGSSRKAALRPRAKRYTSETLPDRDLLILGLLTLWRADIWWYHDVLTEDVVDTVFPSCVAIYTSPADPAVRWSLGRTFRYFIDSVVQCPPDNPKYPLLLRWVKEVGPAVLSSVSNNLLSTRTDLQTQRMLIQQAYEIMYRYAVNDPSDTKLGQSLRMDKTRVSSFALAEIAFLVSLCSFDPVVSYTACQCLRLLAQAERQPEAPQASDVSEDEVLKRHPIYEQLGDPKISMIGRVGHQKRVRKLMRLLTSPSAIHVAVWQELYFRWCALTEMTIRMTFDQTADGLENGTAPVGDKSLSSEDRQAQWQNLTLLLSSFGAACTRDYHDPSALLKIIPHTIIPDSCRVLRDPNDLLTNFLTETVNLLVNDLPQVRDVAREALSNEASHRLYARIVKQLDDVIRMVTDDEHVNYPILVVFLDQFIAILKVLSENVHNLAEDLRVIDIPSTLYTLATFISRVEDTELASVRLKVKFCTLCNSVFSRTEPVIMRNKESSMRQSIADIIVDWVQDTPAEDGLPSAQNELNVAVFRAAVTLFDRLQLEPSDGTTGEDVAHAVSRLFIRYATFLVKTWEISRYDGNPTNDGISEKSSLSKLRLQQREGDLRELLINGLSSLVSANTECGVKHCLSLAYDPDPTKRLIFAYVFVRVLKEGIKFTPYEEAPVVVKQSRLCELVKGPDMALALAICEICPPNEVDAMNAVLLNLFDTRSALMNLLKTMIDNEIAKTESDTALFRSNSTCTRFLSAFARVYGYNYLRSLIVPLVKSVTSVPPGHGYELDPAKVSKEELRQNKETVEFVTSKFLEIISSSIPALPSIIREICAHIAKAVNEVWPEAKFAALGAFIFLRFISPAIVTPETVDVTIPPDPTVRRGLMVIAKIIQNLANNILFGKEAHMVILNDFLKENIVTVTKFLSEINKYVPPGPEDEADEWLERTYDDTDTIVLHRFFEKHADKIGKELLSSSKVSAEKMTPEAETQAANGKRAWDALCAALVELGQPLESPKMSTLTSREHREYLDLMARCDRRDTTTVQELFVEGATPQDSNAVFVLSVSKIDVEVLDLELLLYYIFKNVTSPTNESRDFDIILDFTGFTSTSQIPAQWLKFATETIPTDIWRRFRTLRLLAPNTFALRYLRRLYNNLTSGATESIHITIHTAVGELLSQYPNGLTAPSLGYAVGLESELSDDFDDVTMRQTHPMRVPVSMRVAQSHIRITTTKALPISNLLSCKATEIIPLSDINDVYNVSTGHDSHEFIIRKIRQGVTLYFSSPHRDGIVKAVRAAKSLMQSINLPTAERHSRLSNIITTLLRLALLGISSDEDEPRGASVSLLSAICTYLDFEGRPSVPAKGFYASGHGGPFMVSVSEGLANHAPHLTMDFIAEVASSYPKMATPMRANSLQYLGPWVKNLPLFVDPTSKFYEPSGTRFRDCIRLLIDLTTSESELSAYVHKYIWTEIGKLETNTTNIILDELMRAAVDGGMGSTRCERVADTMVFVNSINVRGRILARIRKVIGKTSIKPTRNLSDNVHWNEIACLTRLVMVVGNASKNVVQGQLFVPEIMHLVTLIAATGQLYVRATVYGIITHMLHTLYSLRLTDSTASPEIMLMVEECCQPEGMRLFGISKPTPTSDFMLHDPPNGKALIDDLEALTRLLLRIMETISVTRGLLNVWRARWMSLITSSAFQLSPAVQSRAFVALGVLATSDVDDDLLYQMLVAFKTALSQASETDTTSVVSMLRCITNVVPATNGNSRYLAQLFWLAVALLQSSHMALYVEAIRLLQVTVENMADHGLFKERGVTATLLEGRMALEEIACQLDHLLGLSFDSNFSFSLAATIFKGVRHSALRDAAEGALRSLLNITVRSCVEVEHADDGPGAAMCQEVLGYVLALIPMSTRVHSFRRLLEEANVDPSWLSDEVLMVQSEDDPVYKLPFGLIGYGDSNTALLVTSFVVAMLATAQGDDYESAILYNILSDVADAWPEVIGMTYESLQDKIKEAFANSNSPTILIAVSNVFRVATHELERVAPPTSRNFGAGSASTLSTVDEGVVHGPGRRHLNALEEQGMQGLVNSFQFLPLNRGHATKMIQWISELVMKMIE